MKQLLPFILILFTIQLVAQGELANASVKIDVRNTSQIEVIQKLVLNLPDSTQQFELKALKFKGTQLKLNTIQSDGNVIKFSEDHSDELQTVTINSNDKSFENIELKYTLETDNELVYLPIFFTNLAASSSDNDFFKAELKMTRDQNMLMHFPKVDMIEKETSTEKILSMQVPALPSLFRIELPLKGEISKMSIAAIVDWLVVLIFILIGAIIWKKRKQLMYG